MSYTIKQGVRPIGLQRAQVMVAGFWTHIFVDCMDCDQSIGLLFDSNEEADEFTDQQFLAVLHENNWAFDRNKLILCPKCGKKWDKKHGKK